MGRVRAGQLDRRITIEKNTPGQDDAGAPTESWATFATVDAAVQPRQGREFFDSHQVNPEVDTVFVIRHRTDLDETMRINYGGKLYDIHFIGEIGRLEGLEIMASALVT